MRHRKIASPGSISELGIRLVNLRALIRDGQPNMAAVAIAQDIDSDLRTIQVAVTRDWQYTTTSAPPSSSPGSPLFEGKRHNYNVLWLAEIWNHWRMLRIAVNQILAQPRPWCEEGKEERDSALSSIRAMSEELCISVSSFDHNPRKKPASLSA